MTAEFIRNFDGEESQGVERASCLSSSKAGQLRGIKRWFVGSSSGSSSILLTPYGTVSAPEDKPSRLHVYGI